MVTTTSIKEIALNAREEFENRKVDKILYGRYAKIHNLKDFLKKAQGMFPKLNCGLTCVYLQRNLGEGEIVNGKYGMENHTFLLLNKKTVVDITADQYGGPKVYCGPLKYPWILGGEKNVLS
jgi:hypothetical protein